MVCKDFFCCCCEALCVDWNAFSLPPPQRDKDHSRGAWLVFVVVTVIIMPPLSSVSTPHLTLSARAKRPAIISIGSYCSSSSSVCFLIAAGRRRRWSPEQEPHSSEPTNSVSRPGRRSIFVTSNGIGESGFEIMGVRWRHFDFVLAWCLMIGGCCSNTSQSKLGSIDRSFPHKAKGIFIRGDVFEITGSTLGEE
jgi:hypothetical protein